MATAKFARYGPRPRYDTPSAGLCLSSFAILRRDGRFLVVRARKHPRWTNEWAANWRMYSKKDMREEYTSWRLPAAYLKEGEHPDHTLMRILKHQLGLRKYTITNSSIYSFHDPSTWYPGKRHWDICFVYDAKTSERVKHKPWFDILAWLPIRSVRSRELGSAHGDLARVLGLTK